MEIYRDLKIESTPEQLESLFQGMTTTPVPGWSRDLSAEEQLRQAIRPRIGFCVSCTEERHRPASTLLLSQKGSGAFEVSNILPKNKHRLSPGEYNAILESFIEHILRPSAETSTTWTLSLGHVDLEHWMSPETAELLRRFSTSANRVTGASHPSDRDRWNEFVVEAARDDSKMTSWELRRWLTEVEGWSPEVAAELAREYEYGRELLAFAAKPRRSA